MSVSEAERCNPVCTPGMRSRRIYTRSGHRREVVEPPSAAELGQTRLLARHTIMLKARAAHTRLPPRKLDGLAAVVVPDGDVAVVVAGDVADGDVAPVAPAEGSSEPGAGADALSGAPRGAATAPCMHEKPA